jgi:hemin uptake protein HemP
MSYQSPTPATADHTLPRPSQPVFDARRLAGSDGTAFIVLDDKTYTLRITRAGKLILTK